MGWGAWAGPGLRETGSNPALLLSAWAAQGRWLCSSQFSLAGLFLLLPQHPG